jgi:hypothetical protein
MYMNKARLDHTGSDDFDMGSVIVPTLVWKPHAESSAYRSHVSVHPVFSRFLSDRAF